MAACCAGTYPYSVKPGDSLWLIARRFNTSIQAIAQANPGLDINNLYVGQIILVPARYNQTPAQGGSAGIGRAELNLNNLIRLLWEQHVYWTRMFVISTAFDLPDLQVVTNRLLRNRTDFAAALRTFYGEDIASRFARLLTAHLTIAAEVVNAAKSGDSAAAQDAEKRWYENADEIAAFLGSINPFWSVAEWQKMLYDHLALLKTEVVYILTGQYQDSVNIFERVEQQALMMADVMTSGIIRQFPQYFR